MLNCQIIRKGDDLRKFLESFDTSVTIFSEFTSLSNDFIRFNTPVPTSAPVERVFSTGGSVLTSKTGSMKCSNFENLLL